MEREGNGSMNKQPHNQKESQTSQSVLAIVAAILGLVSLFIGIFAGVPAVVCGHVALFMIGKPENRLTGKGLAIFALVTGYIAIAFFVFKPVP